MSSVTFPVDLGGDGSTVTDDANASTGLANGGHRTRLVPALSQTVAMANTAKNQAQVSTTKATEAASSATAAAASESTATTKASEASTSATAAANSATNADAARAAAVDAQNNAVAVVTGGDGSLTAAPGTLPLADANGRLHASWYAALLPNAALNDVGVPGTAGFGVGVCPSLPAGFTPMPGATDPLSANYGNYQYSDGSIMVWIPAFWMRLAHADNPTYGTYGVNSVDVLPIGAYPSAAEANADGYYRHRAFVNGGADQLGFFRDKYDCSNNGGVASSIALAMPMVSGPAADQVGFSAVGATNAYHGAIGAARTRGAQFFPETVFMADALTRLSEAHGQAATSTTWCAWYSASTTNFPKGNNNNALKDTNDTGVTFTSAGSATYPNFAKTGSGSPFAKTTHNGQACGVADVNGNIYKINPGMTCVAASKTITGATQANPVQITIVGHGYATGDVVMITSVGGMTQLNDKLFVITSTGADTFTLDGTDGTAFGAFTAGGSATKGTFYLLKESVDIDTITSGTTLATDHWGATGVAALFDAVTLNFATTYGANAFAQRYGNAANQVFGWASTAQRALSMAGMPAAAGMSVSGSNLMGTDYYYQYIRDQLCVISRGSWADGSYAGARFRNLVYARANAYSYVGFAASCYL